MVTDSCLLSRAGMPFCAVSSSRVKFAATSTGSGSGGSVSGGSVSGASVSGGSVSGTTGTGVPMSGSGDPPSTFWICRQDDSPGRRIRNASRAAVWERMRLCFIRNPPITFSPPLPRNKRSRRRRFSAFRAGMGGSRDPCPVIRSSFSGACARERRHLSRSRRSTVFSSETIICRCLREGEGVRAERDPPRHFIQEHSPFNQLK